MVYEKCREILLRECELIQKAGSLQSLIREAVLKREWAGFEARLEAVNGVEKEIAALEKEREGLFAEWSGGAETFPFLGDEKGRFYAMTARLPAEQRSDLCAVYRSLKLEALKLRGDNDALMGYLNGMRTTLAGFFEIAFPDRSGKIYTRQGTPRSQDMRSVVLNRRM
jgi:hypothetical protein